MIKRLEFACFRLVSVDDREAGEPAYSVVRLQHVRTRMAAFAT